MVFHVYNRAARRSKIFDAPADYRLFESLLAEGCRRRPMRVLTYCIMPNHWHLLLWPREDGDLAAFMKWTTGTHATRWQMSRNGVGEGAVYQGRFKAVPVQSDRHLLTVARYIERNPVRASLVSRAEEWRWSSAAPARTGSERPPLAAWPVERPADWAAFVAQPEESSSIEAVRISLRERTPFGDDSWSRAVGERLGAGVTCRRRGRPPKATDGRK